MAETDPRDIARALFGTSQAPEEAPAQDPQPRGLFVPREGGNPNPSPTTDRAAREAVQHIFGTNH